VRARAVTGRGRGLDLAAYLAANCNLDHGHRIEPVRAKGLALPTTSGYPNGRSLRRRRDRHRPGGNDLGYLRLLPALAPRSPVQFGVSQFWSKLKLLSFQLKNEPAEKCFED
jgi:hypothetical protein